MDASNILSALPKGYLQLAVFALGVSLYLLGLLVYRLFLSPIAHFPGSRLSAATGWYETFFDVYKGGQFVFQIEKWHRQYGPIIRINPWEVHIADPEFYEVLYSSKSRFDKIEHLKHRFGLPLSTFDTIHHDHHHRRRTAISPFFSRQRILQYSPYIQARVDKLCNRLRNEYSGTSKVVCMNDMWATLTTDLINYYSFAMSYDFQDYPDFVAPFTTSIKLLAQSLHLMGHFPWFLSLLQSLPDFLVGVLNPTMKPVFEYQAEITTQIRKILNGENDSHKSVAHRTVFSELLHSNLPKEELSLERLKHEALSITGGGIDTTKTTLVLGSYYIIRNPEIRQRLHAELAEAMPDPSAKALTVPELERLPYLNAIVQESLRLSFGIVSRLSRIDPHHPIHYASYTIPANTPFGMTSYLMHRDPRIFPDPDRFNPDRWLDNPVAPLTGKPLSRYLVPFGRGPRMCLGINLAMAELFIGLAGVFRRSNFELFETEQDAVDMAADYLIPMPREGTKGVRVTVK